MALQRELSRIVQAGTSATVGIAVSALTSGAGALALPPPLGLNTTELFPMASTFKVPLACVVLRMVDAGELQLTDMIQLGLRDVRPGTGVLTLKLLENQGSPGPENTYTIHQLLETAMNDSDNTATDVLLRKVGGPEVVTEYARALGLQSLTVTRGCLEHLRDRCGVRVESTPKAALFPEALLCTPGPPLPGSQEMVEFVATLEGRMEVLPLRSLSEADAAYDADPRDQTTPEDMNKLLQLIWYRQAGVSEEGTRVLLEIMAGCRTGTGRIAGRLPEYAVQEQRVLHKTGSLGGRANDVGFVQLPDGKGAVAIAVYTKGLAGPEQTTAGQLYAERDRVIADLARACYDYYLFHE